MLTWANHQDEYLDEMLRLEGRGYAAIYSKCGGCEQPNPTFRCAQQTCYGPSLFCRACIVKQHAALPTHWVQEWNGAFFERRALIDLGLIIQLGHPCGYSCSNPLRAPKDFVLIDVTGVHNVAVNFCECDSRIEKRQQLMRVCWWPATARNPQTCATFGVVRLFQIMNCLGKVSAHDFLRSLELLTNNDGLHPLPDRRRAFRHIVRQYRTTLMMKRSGRGHDPTGVQGTAQGELGLLCRACPQDGMNLDPGWNRINWAAMPEDLRYKYFLFLAQDCNFRLINRNVSSAAKDPILGDGFGYFCQSRQEISSCSGFQAMFLANRKRVKGLRTTGVGGVTCARHNMWRANGIGDLQLGERYSNMDFIFFSAILNYIIFYLILSYDIACQYSKNFWTRMESLPVGMWLLIEQARNWEFTNGAAASTKMMGLGTRHATLEDIFGFHNWRRLVSWRGIFTKRMAENVKEGQVHRDAFDAFDTALREAAPEMVAGWKKWVDEWEAKQHTDGTESPFEVDEKRKVMSMAQIRTKLAKEELLRSGEGVEVEREDTPSTFIMMGLEIEESQRHLAIDVKAVANPTDAQALDFLKRRKNLLKRLRVFRKWQRTYMPNVRRFLTASQRPLWDSEADREVEGVRLFMPSDILDKAKRSRACAVGLVEVEEQLRVGEARDALAALRQGLRTRTMTNRFRLRHCTGQRMLTRGQGVLRQISMKIHKAKSRYRYACNALMRLRGHGGWEKELQVLEDSDVRALNERALTAEEAAQRERGGIAALGVVALGESRRTLSGIWYSAKSAAESGEPTEEDLNEGKGLILIFLPTDKRPALRVEWCKAYARTRRWYEDVVLVEEEMRRTIEFGYSMASKWAERARGRVSSVDQELLDGLTVYAREQEYREILTCETLAVKWSPVREKGRAFLARETTPGVGIVIPLDEDDELHDDDDDEESPPDYEDEGDEEVIE
ncbi:hypothetical protein B0H19DRAFT_1208169 [Mycena capillaripes]|nr:hypothetical protein B0H19DRAFT_1208169 [Mycena capillaripes]